VEYAIAKFELELEKELATASGSIDSQRRRKGELDGMRQSKAMVDSERRLAAL
jgi:hypothetical protein